MHVVPTILKCEKDEVTYSFCHSWIFYFFIWLDVPHKSTVHKAAKLQSWTKVNVTATKNGIVLVATSN